MSLVDIKNYGDVSNSIENMPSPKCVFLMNTNGNIVDTQLTSCNMIASVLKNMADDLAFLIKNKGLFNWINFDILQIRGHSIIVKSISDEFIIVRIFDTSDLA